MSVHRSFVNDFVQIIKFFFLIEARVIRTFLNLMISSLTMGVYGAPSTPSREGVGVRHKMATSRNEKGVEERGKKKKTAQGQ